MKQKKLSLHELVQNILKGANAHALTFNYLPENAMSVQAETFLPYRQAETKDGGIVLIGWRAGYVNARGRQVPADFRTRRLDRMSNVQLVDLNMGWQEAWKSLLVQAGRANTSDGTYLSEVQRMAQAVDDMVVLFPKGNTSESLWRARPRLVPASVAAQTLEEWSVTPSAEITKQVWPDPTSWTYRQQIR